MELSEKARLARNEYMRQWRKNNPEKVREYQKEHQRRYWERKAEQAEKESSEGA